MEWSRVGARVRKRYVGSGGWLIGCFSGRAPASRILVLYPENLWRSHAWIDRSARRQSRRPDGRGRGGRRAESTFPRLAVVGPDPTPALRSRAVDERRLLAASRFHEPRRLRPRLLRHATVGWRAVDDADHPR